MHVLFVGFVWPEPTSSAAGQNILSYMNTCLAIQYNVSFCSAADLTERSHNLTNLGINTFKTALNCNSFNQQIINIKPDIVVFDRYLSFEQFAWRVKESCPNAMLVLDAEDLHCLREARHKLIKQKQSAQALFMQSDNILKQENLPLLYNDIALRELACIYQSDLTLLLSTFEHDVLVRYFNVPANQLSHIPFILPHTNEINAPYRRSFEQKQNFVFIGNFRHAPNYHAVKILREQCWPKIHNLLKGQFPSVKCEVYGAYMSPKAKQLENKKIGFVMHGYAKSQFEAVSSARVMLAPISFGAGVKGKLLDAMQSHTPSITTPIGCEGITQKSWPGEIVSTVDDFVNAAVSFYTQQPKWENANEQAKQILDTQYDSHVNAEVLSKCLQDKYARFMLDRTTNFNQKLLGHHQFQTSKYMSQWIEAKNK